MKTQQVAALYCRISRDDEKFGDSASIETQKNMLAQYAESNGFEYNFYVDDGYSGTTFDRPGFNQMIVDIQDKKINIVITKDLSRLGRDYLKTGYYIDLYFDENNVRYIAINDGVDSANGNDEFIPFKNIINEWHSRDLSRKVKSAYRTKSLNGEFTAAYAPYGYMKNPDNKNQLIIDENTAAVVKRIFQMAADGLSVYKIATRLTNEKILTPRAYIAMNEGKYKNALSHPTDWNHGTIVSIIHNREYLGNLVCNKSTTKSFKNKKIVRNPEEQWIEIPNTHQPIIDKCVFDMAQKTVKTKQRENPVRENIFAGLLCCSDCGRALGYVKGKTEGHEGAYNCNLYRQKSTKYCTAHYITHKALYQIVLIDIMRHMQIAKKHEDELFEYARKVASDNATNKYKWVQKELEKCKQRNGELYTIIKTLFEQSALGSISSERFSSMSADYEKEKKDLTARIAELEIQIEKRDIESGNTTEKSAEIVRKYTEIDRLSTSLLRGLVDKIVVHNAETVNGRKHQQIEIFYKFSPTGYLVETGEE